MRAYARFVFAAMAVCFIILNLFGVFDNSIGSQMALEKNEEEDRIFEHLQEIYEVYSQCLVKLLATLKTDLKFWENYATYSSICINQTDFKKIKISEYANSDEHKFYVHHSKEDIDPSVVVTLGIGKDVKVEAELKVVLNKGSAFYGADPIVDDNERLYSAIGHFYPFAVGKKTGISQANVFENGKYAMQQMMHVDIMTFMKDMIRKPIIDMFLMDNEGPEYDIIPLMLPEKEFDNSNITICQTNIEIHGGHDPECHKLMLEVLRTRRFVPLKSVNVGHIRVFLVNIKSEYCVNRYLRRFFVSD